jgi:hypothetical protein
LKTHHIYGLTLASGFPFTHRLSPGEGVPDLTFSCTPLPPVPSGEGSRLYSSPWRDEAGESIAHFDRYPRMDVLRFPGTADFHLEPGRITGNPSAPAQRDLMEMRLLGPVLSFWLERLGIPALHASAVRLGRGAAAFLSHSGGGKSSLAAAFVQAGAALLTDDVLPVEESGETFLARPGYPQMRLEPDGVRHFLDGIDGLKPVSADDTKLHVPVGTYGFGAFHDSPLPLTALYVIERAIIEPGSRPEIVPLTRREAVIELVRHSFSPYLVEALGLQPRRLDLFARLVRRVPVLRLSYPAGLEHLPGVVEAVLNFASS